MLALGRRVGEMLIFFNGDQKAENIHSVVQISSVKGDKVRLHIITDRANAVFRPEILSDELRTAVMVFIGEKDSHGKSKIKRLDKETST